jgi:hypothetical protein
VAFIGMTGYGAAVERVALILLLFILLMNGRHPGTDPPARFDSVVVQAEPLPLPGPEEQRRFYGPLRLTGAWQLSSPSEQFGGLSSLLVERDGSLLALNDNGELFGFRVNGAQGRGYLKPLPRPRREMAVPAWKWDSESMQRDPVTGRIWVGFELIQRICRYAPGFTRREGCVSPAALKAWPEGGGIESLVRLGDGRFIAISEMGYGREGYDVLLFAGDPLDPRAPPPIHLDYAPPAGFRPTDALWLGGDRLLVLNRRVTLDKFFTAQIALVHLPPMHAGTALRAETVATLAPPLLADNFEALALGWERGQPVLWVASDDNHFSLQRTLLLRFALPPSWVRLSPG